ncbi:hypothetical protein EVJ58_g10258 [Rhodofomes roseus]|uniref:Cryptic loci regulator 2 N-terminal domain-containing protein n=1 Tax=Rhodofomes roseus TaxID=34475 RepID=A0A4Y9XRI6_9APHY|nr:hypothetical protein EVJ58_g10258 [Rhodofomes roseus]
MSQRKLGAKTSLPDDPEWITFPRSDGDAKLLPKNTERIVDSSGQVNFMRPVGLDESAAINWRVGVGSQVAIKLDYPEGPSYVLKNWPDGYQFYDHNKGPAPSPRHDPYLCGSTLVNRFRSINEFIPHAVWLMTDETLNRANCECKYCAKKPQRVVTEVLALPSGPRRGSSTASSPSKSIRRHREVRKPRQYAQVRRAPKPVKTVRAGPEQSLVQERDNDVRHSLVTGEAGVSRWHRKGELVWCALNPPIRGEKEDGCIQFWPGIVDRVDVHTDVLRHENAIDAALESMQIHPAELDPGTASGEDNSPVVSGDANTKPPWDVRQWYSYNVKLLAVTSTCVVSDNEVLPYLAYAPSEQLLGTLQDQLQQIMHTNAIAEMDSDLTRTFLFSPIPEKQDAQDPFAGPSTVLVPDFARYREAVVPFSLAVQIASNVAGFWGPTDEWECKFTIPTNTPPPPPPEPRPHASTPAQESDAGLSLEALLTQAAENNAVDVNHRATAQNVQINPDGIYRPQGMSDEEFEERRTRMLGQHPVPAPVVTQTRYQGLWWGAERIWTDELVRLKLARCQFAPAGTDVFYPPAGPSASGARMWRTAATRRPWTNDGSGTTKECRACGQLYELADGDWEDPMEPSQPPPQASGSSNGKGKERASDVGAGANGSVAVSQGQSGPSFMPGPSPLKPPPLPNPDPAVSVADTADAALAQTTQGSGKFKAQTVGSQLSHPANSVPYPLPRPPKGFKFHRIHPPGHEVVLSLPLISGRYYPGLLEHPLMQPLIDKAFDVPSSDGGLEKSRHLWAMEGLVAGVHQSMDPTIWKPSRTVMFKDADAESRSHFKALWEEVKESRVQIDMSQYLNPDAMDVDMY